VRAIIAEDNIPPGPEAQVATKDITYPAAAGDLPARIYTPPGSGPFPVIGYFHGGGWVLAEIDTYDASARAIAAATPAIVVSFEYRRAPENRFPAAHEDALAAWQWLAANAGSLGGDPQKLAVAGESAGANLAFNVALAARDNGWPQPRHQLLIYPVAGHDMDNKSYVQNAEAVPLGKEDMAWFLQRELTDPAQADDPRLNLVARTGLEGMPATTVIAAQIDPLRTEDTILAAALSSAGVSTKLFLYPGVTHEFFGMSAVVAMARDAVTRSAKRVRASFAD
jgi:acetyl esterase/lipase